MLDEVVKLRGLVFLIEDGRDEADDIIAGLNVI